MKEALAVGRADACELLLDPPDYVEKVRLIEFLTWLPKYGKVRARTLIRSATAATGLVPETIELRRLSPRTREELVAKLHAKR